MTTKQLAKKPSRKEVLRELWRRGNLDYKRHSGQMKMKDYINNSPKAIIPILASRRMGKSFELLMEAVELCTTKPNAIVKYICPRLKMVKQIVHPNMRTIIQDCPIELKPQWKEQEKVWVFPNGSEIQFAGTDNKNYEALRGGASDLCIVDEAGFCDDLDDIIKSVLRPTLLTTGGKIVMISTPSKTSDHEFIVNYINPMKNAGELLVLNIYDNPMLTPAIIEELKQDYPTGDKDPKFRREYLCEIIRDNTATVIPEFDEEREKRVVREWDRPAFYDSYTSGDVGFRDLTVYLFGYWDFMQAKLIIEDELVMNGPEMTTERLAAEIKRKENINFKDAGGEPLPVYMRVMDNNLIMVNDLSRLHGLNFIPTAKDNKEAQINAVRLMMSNDQIIINPRCKHLIYHVRNALWKDGSGKNREFARLGDTPDFSIRGGHADALDALIYLVRNLVRSHNPYPPGYFDTRGENIQQSLMGNAVPDAFVAKVKKILNIK